MIREIWSRFLSVAVGVALSLLCFYAASYAYKALYVTTWMLGVPPPGVRDAYLDTCGMNLCFGLAVLQWPACWRNCPSERDRNDEQFVFASMLVLFFLQA